MRGVMMRGAMMRGAMMRGAMMRGAMMRDVLSLPASPGSGESVACPQQAYFTIACPSWLALGGTKPPSVNKAPPSVNKAPPSVNKAPPSVNMPPPSVNKAPPSVNKPPPSVNKAPPSVNKPPPSVNIGSVPANVTKDQAAKSPSNGPGGGSEDGPGRAVSCTPGEGEGDYTQCVYVAELVHQVSWCVHRGAASGCTALQPWSGSSRGNYVLHSCIIHTNALAGALFLLLQEKM